MNRRERTLLGYEVPLYRLPGGGISELELDLNAIGPTLGLTMMRTKGTIDQIAAKHFVD